MWGHMNGGGWGWSGMWLGMLLFWGIGIAVFLALVKYARGADRSGERPREKSALDILKERYARGEIGRDEFEQKKRDLTQ